MPVKYFAPKVTETIWWIDILPPLILGIFIHVFKMHQSRCTTFPVSFCVIFLPTKFVGRAYHQKSPLIWTAYLWNCMSHDQRDQGHIPQKFEVIFVGFRLMKNIIFNKTKSFVGWIDILPPLILGIFIHVFKMHQSRCTTFPVSFCVIFG
jgi:uncharacterized protein with PQ loop repeat